MTDIDDSPLICRSVDGVRTIEGLVVPWEQEASFRGRKERFAAGGLAVAADRVVALRWEHTRGMELPIGVLARSVDTPEGLWTSWELHDGDLPSLAWQNADAGVARGFSAEFVRRSEIESGRSARDGGVIDDGILVGAALTEAPVYAGARITSVRSRRDRWDGWHDWASGAARARTPKGTS